MILKKPVTLYDLEQKFCEYQIDHQTKELGDLLIEAMRDWPGTDCEDIDVFIKELKDFYEDNITLESIENKHPDRTNAIDLWKHEAGASIAEMIELSKKYYNEDCFFKILQRILDK